MKCPVCGKRIDDDSRYCDQCGVELFRCPACGVSGRGPVCVRDGTPLGRFARKGSPGPAVDKSTPEGDRLVLTNATLGVRLEVRDGDVLGRTEGGHAHVLEAQRSVSGRHAEVRHAPDGVWMITDLGSTNGTRVDGVRLRPAVAVQLRPGSRIVLANVEFLVGAG